MNALRLWKRSMQMFKPIIFSTEMVRAIQARRKTMTRRVMKPQPIIDERGMWDWKDCQWMEGGLGFPQSGIEDHAPYQPGDILWVRETWAIMECAGCPADCPYECTIERNGLTEACDDRTYLYKATDNFDGPAEALKWRPSIHMPKAAARIFLRVKSVWPEKVQDISETDATKEGCFAGIKIGGETCTPALSAKQGFMWLWDFLNAKRGYGWCGNPWVWAYEFVQTDKPVDFLAIGA